MPTPSETPDFNERYSRQTRFAPFGAQGQHNLEHTHVLVMGAGALGSHIAEQLVRMGVGKLTIVDMDIVELTNLHRQALYDETDVTEMRPKVYTLADKLKVINSNVEVDPIYEEITSTNIETMIQDINPDILLDGMDHFAIRFLFNEVCHKLNLPWIYGAAVGGKGSVYAIDYTGPCLRCFMEETPETAESCAINGVIPPVIMQVVSYQIAELMRYVSGKGFSGKLITVSPFEVKQQSMDVSRFKNPNCTVCAQGNYEYLGKRQSNVIEGSCGDTFVFRFKPDHFDNADLFPGQILKANPYVKLLNVDGYEATLFKDGRMNIHHIEDEDTAETLYRTLLKAVK
ncbi:thiamine/molybdopterin biosynthesis protein [Staphylococcus simulans]|uniref:ThiF family adenylyltransferase n=1 Tax=Staphylococcus simulans TaxID=1286 RepID=UPI000D1F6F5D|nr:ThiF family adenylyltransferase [Staphylococcus simulans]PTJ22765.1 thiamine/molybdopterin biosynthesis protein [Staphylococcus simulans]